MDRQDGISKRLMNRRERITTLLLGGFLMLVGAAAPISASPASPAVQDPPALIARLLPPAIGGAPANIAAEPVERGNGCLRDIPRSRKDRPDRVSGRQVHVVYLLPADAHDERLDARGILDCSMKAQNEWFEEASGGRRWRFDTFVYEDKNARGRSVTREAVDVSVVRSARPSSQLGGAFNVKDDLGALGFNDPNKRYLSYVAADSSACGDAIMPIIFSPGAQPDGQYAQVYLRADEACGAMNFGAPGKPSFSEAIAQQELIHNDGIVQFGAPHGCLMGTPPGMGHVCTGPLVLTEGGTNLDPERLDALYPFVSVPLSEKVLDIGNDDYFNHLFPHMVDLSRSPYLEAS